jgi:hypothetical protein
MIRSLNSSFFALGIVSALAIGCSNPAVDAEAASDEAAFTASASNTATSYAGTFAVNGQSFTLEVVVRTAAKQSVTQTIWSTKWHADSIGRCGAYTSAFGGSIRVRVKDAAGAIVVDDEKDASADISDVLDRAECADGLIANPKPIGTLDAVLGRAGIVAELAGSQVALPFGYGEVGTFAIGASARFTAQEALQYAVTSDGSNGYHSSESTVRGTITVVPANEIKVLIGTGTGFGFETIQLQKR